MKKRIVWILSALGAAAIAAATNLVKVEALDLEFESLVSAIDYLHEDYPTETLTIINDVTEGDIVLPAGTEFVFDLNGYALEFESITIDAGATLTIADSSEDSDGQMVATAEGDAPIVNNGTLVVTGGNFAMSPSDLIQNGANATVEISGGMFAGEIPVEFIAGEYASVDNGDGTYSVSPAIGYVVGEGDVKTYYASMASFAAADANAGNVLVLTSDVLEEVQLEPGQTLRVAKDGYQFADDSVEPSSEIAKVLVEKTGDGVTVWTAKYDLSLAEVQFTGGDQYYDLTAHTPDFNVTIGGLSVASITNFLSDADYSSELVYEIKEWGNNIKASENEKAYVTISGIGLCDGEKTANFTIMKPTSSVVLDSVVATEVGGDQDVTVDFRLNGLVDGVGYTLKVVIMDGESEITNLIHAAYLDTLPNGLTNGSYRIVWSPGEMNTTLKVVPTLDANDNNVNGIGVVIEGADQVDVDSRPRWTISFEASSQQLVNDQEANEMPASQTFTNGVPGTLVSNQWTCRGYEFDGWTIGDSEDIVYSDGEEVTFDDNTVLRCHWTPVTYTIDYVLADSEKGIDRVKGVEGNPYEYTVEDNYTLANPERIGHTFTGWSGTGIEDTTNEVVIANTYAENLTFTANWEADTGDNETPQETDDIADLDGNTDLPANSVIKLIVKGDITKSITVPAAVTNLILVFEAATPPHSIGGGTDGLAPLVFDGACDLTISGAFQLLPPAPTPAPTLMGASGSRLRLLSASEGLTATASPGKSGLDGEDAVELAGIDTNSGDGTCTVTFRVRLREGQDFNAWLYRANLAGSIKILAADSLAALVAGGDGVDVLDAQTSAIEITGDAAERLVTFTISVPEECAARFFRVDVE